MQLEDLQQLIMSAGGSMEINYDSYDLNYLGGSVAKVAGRRKISARIDDVDFFLTLVNKHLDTRTAAVAEDPRLEDLIEEVFNGQPRV